MSILSADCTDYSFHFHTTPLVRDFEALLFAFRRRYVRSFLKPFLQRGQIASSSDLERLGKKLAQKVHVYFSAEVCSLCAVDNVLFVPHATLVNSHHHTHRDQLTPTWRIDDWQVYEKELPRGTTEINSENCGRIKKYVATYFERRQDDPPPPGQTAQHREGSRTG